MEQQGDDTPIQQSATTNGVEQQQRVRRKLPLTRQLSGEDADKSEDEKQDSIKPGKSDSLRLVSLPYRPFLCQPLIGVMF